MPYDANIYEPVENIRDIEQSVNKVYEIEDILKDKIFTKENYKRVENMLVSNITEKVSFDLYAHIKYVFDSRLEKLIDGCLVRKIELKVDDTEITPCMELLFLQGNQVFHYYRMPIDSGKKVKEIINRNAFVSKIQAYFENSNNMQENIEREQQNILMVFILVEYLINR